MTTPDLGNEVFERWFANRNSWTDGERVEFFASLDEATVASLRRTIEVFEIARQVVAGAEEPGQVIDGFCLEMEIGRGSAGVVWRAVDVGTGRRVALKLLSLQRTISETLRQRLHREAAILAQLKHPGIVEFLGVGEHAGLPYLVVELVDPPTTLKDLVRGEYGPALSIDETVDLFVRVCRALQHSHENGVIHRDLSPANVLIDPSGAPKLTDFGLSIRPTDPHLTRTDQVIGTPFYMSPEHAHPELGPITAKSDIFAVGIMLFEALTGRLPFGEIAKREPKVDLLKGDPPLAHTLDSRIPLRLSRIVDAAMEHAISRRYDSAGRLADDLVAFRSQKRPTGTPNPTRARLARYRRRYPLAVPAGFATLALLTVAWIGFRSVHSERTRTAQARATLRAEQYRGRLSVASAALADNRVAEARSLLLEAPIALRGWEWLHLWRRAHQAVVLRRPTSTAIVHLAALPGAGFQALDRAGRLLSLDPAGRGVEVTGELSRSVSCADFNPSANKWLMVDERGTVVVLGSEGHVVWKGQGQPSRQCDWISDRSFLTCAADGALTVWRMADLTSFVPVATWDVVEPVRYHPGVDRIISQSPSQTVRLWSVEGEQTGEFDSACGPLADFVPFDDSARVLVLGQGGALLDLDLQSGVSVPASQGHDATSRCVALSKEVVIRADGANRVYLTRERGAVAIEFVGAAARTTHLAMSTDQRWICAATDDGACLAWPAVPPGPVSNILALDQPPPSVVAHPLLPLLAVGCAREAAWLVDTKGGAPKAHANTQKGAVTAIGLSSDAEIVATGGPAGVLCHYDLGQGVELGTWQIPGSIRAISVTPRGNLTGVIVASGNLFLVPTHRRDLGAVTSPVAVELPAESRALACAFAEDESLLVLVQSLEGATASWELLGHPPARLDGLAASSASDKLRLAQLLSGTGRIIASSLRSAGLSIVADADRNVTVFDADTGELRAEFLATYDVVDVAVAARVDRIFVASKESLSIWSLADDPVCLFSQAVSRPIHALELTASPVPRVILAHVDGTVDVWTSERELPVQLLETSDRLQRLRPLLEQARIEAMGDEDAEWQALTSGELAEADRQFARRQLRVLGPMTTRELNEAAWEIVRHPGASSERLRWAVEAVDLAVKSAPGDRFSWHTMGLALLRLEDWSAAHRAFSESDRLDKITLRGRSRAATLAYLALTQARLGDRDGARTTIARAEKLAAGTPRASTKQALAEVRRALAAPSLPTSDESPMTWSEGAAETIRAEDERQR